MIVVKKINTLCIWMQTILYGWAMNRYLPYSGYKWLNKKEINGLFFEFY